MSHLLALVNGGWAVEASTGGRGKEVGGRLAACLTARLPASQPACLRVERGANLLQHGENLLSLLLIGAADDPIQHLLPRTKFLVLWYTCFRKQKKK